MKNFLTALILVITLSTQAQTIGQQVNYYPNGGDAGGITAGNAPHIPAIISYYNDTTDTAWLTILPVENAPAPRSGIKLGQQPAGTPYFSLQDSIVVTISAGPGISISGTYPNFTISLTEEGGLQPGDGTISIVKTVVFNSSGNEVILPSEPGIYIIVQFLSDGSCLTKKLKV